MATDRSDSRPGVLLLNFGGPETLADVRPFLVNLFSDPDIIRIRSDLMRRTLARLIALARQRKSRALYRQIGGGSPLRRITEEQAAALGARLAERGMSAPVYVGMRCWRPSIDEALARIQSDGITRLAVVPLFPQFSFTTTGSCLNYFQAASRKTGLADRAELIPVQRWFDEPLYLEAMVERITEARQRFSASDPSEIHLLYSAHSIPESYIREGDTYRQETEATVEMIDRRLGWRPASVLAYQSRVGPVRWLGPPTTDVLRRLGAGGAARVLVVPVSFVSDHIETLQEIDIRYRDLARANGIREFHRAPSLNLHPKFIAALAEISLRALTGGKVSEGGET